MNNRKKEEATCCSGRLSFLNVFVVVVVVVDFFYISRMTVLLRRWKKKKKFNKMLADASIVPATVALSSPHQNPKKILFKNKNETQKKKKKPTTQDGLYAWLYKALFLNIFVSPVKYTYCIRVMSDLRCEIRVLRQLIAVLLLNFELSTKATATVSLLPSLCQIGYPFLSLFGKRRGDNTFRTQKQEK